ncbi:MAG: tRNA pseudouridine(55) synthase TruB [Patescibacteria group bacterium]|nr:tRNA pseudouridine(55) synthase TruB [Patescibacteria group bacterium]
MVLGIYLINKPVGITSHDVIYKLRKITGEKTIGHAGTLDPMASGLLIVAIGRKFTKQIDQFKNLDKTYEAIVILGASSTTDDSEGDKTEVSKKEPELSEVLSALEKIKDWDEQLPPKFSAKKIKGQTAYNLARKGKKVDLKSVPVKIYDIENIIYNYPSVSFVCAVSSGTYIRSIARDLGEVLGVGGYLSSLVRGRIGEYRLDDAGDLGAIITTKDLERYKIDYE